MNDDLKTKIESILTQCREVIALSENLEKWTLSERAPCIAFGLNDDDTGMAFDSEDVARFAVISRTLTPQLAKALIEAIEGLIAIEEFASMWPNSHQSKQVRYSLQRIANHCTIQPKSS